MTAHQRRRASAPSAIRTPSSRTLAVLAANRSEESHFAGGVLLHASTDTARGFHRRAAERLRDLPGVRSAAVSSFLPLTPARSDCAATSESSSRIPITTGVVDEGYFDVLNVRFVSGRDFARSDSRETEPVVIVNERQADQLWPNEEAAGRYVLLSEQEKARQRTPADHSNFRGGFSVVPSGHDASSVRLQLFHRQCVLPVVTGASCLPERLTGVPRGLPERLTGGP